MQYKPKRNKTIHRFCFFIASLSRIATFYGRMTGDQILIYRGGVHTKVVS